MINDDMTQLEHINPDWILWHIYAVGYPAGTTSRCPCMIYLTLQAEVQPSHAYLGHNPG